MAAALIGVLYCGCGTCQVAPSCHSCVGTVALLDQLSVCAGVIGNNTHLRGGHHLSPLCCMGLCLSGAAAHMLGCCASWLGVWQLVYRPRWTAAGFRQQTTEVKLLLLWRREWLGSARGLPVALHSFCLASSIARPAVAHTAAWGTQAQSCCMAKPFANPTIV